MAETMSVLRVALALPPTDVLAGAKKHDLQRFSVAPDRKNEQNFGGYQNSHYICIEI
jgi:hypothetical protein